MTYCSRPIHVLMIGDSLTEMGDWDMLLPRYDVKNLGVGGHKTSDLMARGYVDEVRDSEADIVCVMVGINDAMNDIEADVIIRNYSRLLDTLAQDFDHIIIQSTLYQGHSRRQAVVSAVNDELEGIAESKGYDYFDVNAVLSQDALLIEDYTTDGTHLTMPAYRLWATKLAELLDARLSTE